MKYDMNVTEADGLQVDQIVIDQDKIRLTYRWEEDAADGGIKMMLLQYVFSMDEELANNCADLMNTLRRFIKEQRAGAVERENACDTCMGAVCCTEPFVTRIWLSTAEYARIAVRYGDEFMDMNMHPHIHWANSDLIGPLRFDTEEGLGPGTCPFLTELRDTKQRRCAIHDIRPEVCRRGPERNCRLRSGLEILDSPEP